MPTVKRLQHNDEPVIAGDLLGRQRFIAALAEQIASCTPPQVFGVHGEWGAGKTSVLRQLERHLADPSSEGEKAPKGRKGRSQAPTGNAAIVGDSLAPSAYKDRVLTIWFEAWRYQHEAQPIVALLQEMRRRFSAAVRAKEALKAVGMTALKTLSGAFDTAAGLIGAESLKLMNPERIVKAAESYDAEHFRRRLPTDTVREFLQSAISELLAGLERKPEDEPRLVILIDDLDRCGAEAAFRLLEGLKIHLNLPNCVFVLGMSQDAVIDLLSKQLGDLRRAESYLEKLCTNVWRLPSIRDPHALLCDWLHSPAAQSQPNDSFGDEALQKLMRGIPNPQLIGRSLPPNPRKLKALANTMLLLWEAGAKTALSKGDALQLQAFVFLAYVYQFHQGLYQRWALAPDFFETLKDWSRDSLGEDLKPIFKDIQRVSSQTTAGADPDKATPQASSLIARSLYPEPGLHGLFWMTPWLQDPNGGAKATAGLFEPLLNAFKQP